jgi:hypothetical protein
MGVFTSSLPCGELVTGQSRHGGLVVRQLPGPAPTKVRQGLVPWTRLVPVPGRVKRVGAPSDTERRTAMDQTTPDSELSLIQGYLEKHLPHCVVEEESATSHQVHLSVSHGIANRCSVQVSVALLTDSHLNCIELRWALKERHIAAHVRWNEAITLGHETLRIGTLGALARRPKR